ncbi:MAG: hypothetical protein ABIK83_01345 [Candidatus Zixiibacteriota bacterium]
MHPSKDRLRLFAEQGMQDAAERERISDHIEECEFCSEFCEDYRSYLESIEAFKDADIPILALRSADTFFRKAVRGRSIALQPLTEDVSSPLKLAADGSERFSPEIVNIAELCSESPEAILRIMRDSTKGIEYVQLISDDPNLAGHIMIQVPEIGWELITDRNGKAVIEHTPEVELSVLKWQIKLPDAIFSMKPLEYDPDETTYSEKVELTSPESDRISVEFRGKTEGKQIVIRILELDGKQDFGDVRVTVSQGDISRTSKTSTASTVSFDLTDSESEVDIRLFR